MPHHSILRTLAWLLSCALVVGSPLAAQDADRIWGRVHTVSGERHEGFIRWDRNEGSWVDVLDGSKDVPPENYALWLEANQAGERPVRTLELKGYRISWNEEDPDFPTSSASGIRFGHLEQLIVTGDDEVELVLRSGLRLTLTGGATDLGPSIREIVVDSDGVQRELKWQEIERVEFFAAPEGARPESRRLYGTATDERGRTYTGYVSWDLDEILESDVLDGDDEDGDTRQIQFGDIRSIEGRRRGSTVSLRSGPTIELEDSNDVSRGNRGIQISDPGLGMIEIEWDEFASLELTPVPESFPYDAFDGGHALVGTVTTRGGEDITGRIRWDADEQWSWEFLDGSIDDIAYRIEFGNIAGIERDELVGVRVTLTDGRVIELEDGNDVDWDNRGILIAPDGEARPSEQPSWRYVSWDEFVAVRFVQGRENGGSES